MAERNCECPICNKNFISKHEFTAHKKLHVMARECAKVSRRNTIQKYECKYCMKTIQSEGSFMLHLSTHIKNELFECNLCNKLFLAENDLVNHLKEHFGEDNTNVKDVKASEMSKAITKKNKHNHRQNSKKQFRIKTVVLLKRNKYLDKVLTSCKNFQKSLESERKIRKGNEEFCFNLKKIEMNLESCAKRRKIEIHDKSNRNNDVNCALNEEKLKNVHGIVEQEIETVESEGKIINVKSKEDENLSYKTEEYQSDATISADEFEIEIENEIQIINDVENHAEELEIIENKDDNKNVLTRSSENNEDIINCTTQNDDISENDCVETFVSQNKKDNNEKEDFSDKIKANSECIYQRTHEFQANTGIIEKENDVDIIEITEEDNEITVKKVDFNIDMENEIETEVRIMNGVVEKNMNCESKLVENTKNVSKSNTDTYEEIFVVQDEEENVNAEIENVNEGQIHHQNISEKENEPEIVDITKMCTDTNFEKDPLLQCFIIRSTNKNIESTLGDNEKSINTNTFNGDKINRLNTNSSNRINKNEQNEAEKYTNNLSQNIQQKSIENLPRTAEVPPPAFRNNIPYQNSLSQNLDTENPVTHSNKNKELMSEIPTINLLDDDNDDSNSSIEIIDVVQSNVNMSSKSRNLFSDDILENCKMKIFNRFQKDYKDLIDELQHLKIPITFNDIFFLPTQKYSLEILKYDFSEEQIKLIRSVRSKCKTRIRNHKNRNACCGKLQILPTTEQTNQKSYQESNSKQTVITPIQRPANKDDILCQSIQPIVGQNSILKPTFNTINSINNINNNVQAALPISCQNNLLLPVQYIPQSVIVPPSIKTTDNNVCAVTISFQHPQDGHEITTNIPIRLNTNQNTINTNLTSNISYPVRSETVIKNTQYIEQNFLRNFNDHQGSSNNTICPNANNEIMTVVMNNMNPVIPPKNLQPPQTQFYVVNGNLEISIGTRKQ